MVHQQCLVLKLGGETETEKIERFLKKKKNIWKVFG